VAMYTDGAMPLHKVTCVPRGHSLGMVSLLDCVALIHRFTNTHNCQTTQLPLDDRFSVSYKEYLAEIDVCMGGRVAEELSKFLFLHQRS
jgi:ATP-dependent metalloprotease